MLEQDRFLLDSSNYQLSVLSRKMVLAAINKAKINSVWGTSLYLMLRKCYLGMTFPPLPQSRLTCHVSSTKTSCHIQGANFPKELALPNVLAL